VACTLAAHRRPRRGGRSACAFHHRRALYVHPARVWAATRGPAPRVLGHAERVLCPSRPHWLVVRRSPSGRLHAACVGPQRPLSAWAVPGRKGRCQPGPCADFGLVARIFKNFHFYFSFSFKLNSNFKNLYLNIQSSKNYEISSVGFIIF
jgi:hypothetical protein